MPGKTNSKDGNGEKKQTFAITAPDAMGVQWAGDFIHWKEQPPTAQKQGVWRTTVELPRDTHRYGFLVDTQWHEDTAKPRMNH